MRRSDFGVDFANNVDEIVVVNYTIFVLVSESNHLVDFSSREVLTNASSDFFELLRAKSAIFALIEYVKHTLYGSLIGQVTAKSENIEEGSEVHLTFKARVVDNVDDLSGLVFKAESTNGVDQLIRGDISTAVIVEHR